jgi:hypothetical protein
VKLQNPPGTHDDLAVAVGMCVVDLVDHPSGLPMLVPSAREFAGRNLLPWDSDGLGVIAGRR